MLMTSLLLAASCLQAANLTFGFGKADITPVIDEKSKAVWIAGYGMGRQALGVHDPLFARAVVLSDGKTKVALAVVDLVGLQYPDVLKIREQLKGFDYVLVASTHQHEGPDVVGLWGSRPGKSGVDPAYIQTVVEKTAQAIRDADQSAIPAAASYGTAIDEEILRDSRLPHVKDGVIRVLHFKGKDGKSLGIVMQQNCHPESLSSKNQYITADFLHFTIKNLEEQYKCPVTAFSGPVGGLMALPGTIKDDNGKELHDGNFEYAEVYGTKLSRRVSEAMKSSEPISLTPIRFTAQKALIPMDNVLYKLGYRTKILNRAAYVWKDDPWSTDPELFDVRMGVNRRAALMTEIAYLQLGDLHVAGIPGEAYPESIYGKYQEPIEQNVDFPDAPLEPAVVDTLPGKKIMVLGLANDEVGYIVPKRQWDFVAPFAYGRTKCQYGEENSCGPEVAPLVYEALKRAVQAVQSASGSSAN